MLPSFRRTIGHGVSTITGPLSTPIRVVEVVIFNVEISVLNKIDV